ncbi:class I SAM-dependent methyltransferase [Marinobacter caseinilyticus]|uniref:class I SAM-dependent methyltransferase n=1 Tax=Marinobacter caseinilyticus TaxID=2692195 RepID=UPI0014093733|nr:methyltransferase domain-containing protein [Marinobacter caseinilyticus]
MSKLDEQGYAERHERFENWFQTPLGRSLLSDQRRCVDAHVEGLSGARQLHVGISHRLPLAGSSDFGHRIVTTPRWQPDLPEGVAVCDPDELPFPASSMDLVILHHSADFSAYPHQVIREASRVVRGGGQMLVLGFNPLSLWGLRKLIFRHRYGPWGGRFMFRSRMEDWLSLLDFQVESARSHFFRLPIQNLQLSDKRSLVERLGVDRFVPIGAYYCILATKRVCAPIVRRPAWRQKNVISLPSTGSLGISRTYRSR